MIYSLANLCSLLKEEYFTPKNFLTPWNNVFAKVTKNKFLTLKLLS